MERLKYRKVVFSFLQFLVQSIHDKNWVRDSTGVECLNRKQFLFKMKQFFNLNYKQFLFSFNWKQFFFNLN